MKIIAHSTVPAGKFAYVHLGYLAATETIPQKGFFLTGALFLVLGLYSLAKGISAKRIAGELKPKWNIVVEKIIAVFLMASGIYVVSTGPVLFGAILMLVALLWSYERFTIKPPKSAWHRVTAVTAGFIMLATGILFVSIYSFKYGEVVYIHAEFLTQLRANILIETISVRTGKNEKIPGTAGLMLKDWNLHPEEIRDGWFNQFRIGQTILNNQTSYTVTSAGPDRTFNTADDIKFNKLP